jgi:integrase
MRSALCFAQHALAEVRSAQESILVGEQHIVPLPGQVVALLELLRPITGGEPLLFPSLRSETRPISNNTINAALRRIVSSVDAVVRNPCPA